MKPLARNQAFTLVELLVVISIIATLGAILFPAVLGVFDDANRAQAKHMVSQLATAITKFKEEYGFYPPDGASGVFSDNGTGVVHQFLNGNGFLPDEYDAKNNPTPENKRLLKLLEDKLFEADIEDLGEWNGTRRVGRAAGEVEDSEFPELFDPWDRPYQYQRYSDDNRKRVDRSDLQPRDNGLRDPRDKDGVIEPFNEDSFDVWSAGSDHEDPTDDIGNW